MRRSIVLVAALLVGVLAGACAPGSGFEDGATAEEGARVEDGATAEEDARAGNSTTGSNGGDVDPSGGGAVDPSTGKPTPGEPGTDDLGAKGADEENAPEPHRLAWGPTDVDLAAARATVSRLSDADLAGLVIVARYNGVDVQTPAGLVADEGFGGVILFGVNVQSLPQVQGVAGAVQHAGGELGRDWPTIVGVDNEGGRVQRLSGTSGPWTTFPPFAAAEHSSTEEIRDAMEAMARELRASGINTNYAPVADITGPGDVAIGSRSPGTGPEPVARAVAAAVEGFRDGGVLSSVKHFPGHGGLAVDSHVGLPIQSRTLADLSQRELLPFAAGIDAGAPMVMVGHIALAEWGGAVPASLSPHAYAYLRDVLGFTGVTITDGLDMGALPGTSAEIAVAAMNAGADILLTPTDPRAARDGLVAALADGALGRERLEEAAGRIVMMMRHQEGLAKEAGEVSDDDVGAGAGAARALAGS